MNSRGQNSYSVRWVLPTFVKVVLTGLVITLAGCAISNEGAVTFRKSTPLKATQEEKPDTDKLLPLEMKNFSTLENAKFVENDSLSVHLRTAYIRDFAEIANPLRVFTRMGLNANGEIAIVANAFEMNTGKELDFADNKSGRLVFYSDDVLKGQFLNFNNMPIYGPIKYNGAPFAFRVTIFELDVESEQAKALLKGLAEVGSIAYPPASPVLSLLNGLGQTLANSDQDDTEFRYTMVLDPKGGLEQLNHFILEAGNYVIVRSEIRENKIPWDKLSLNENEGKVYWNEKEPGKKGELYTENTYLVVEINKNVSSVDIDLSQDSYEALLTALKSEDKEKASNLTMMANALGEAVVPRAQTVKFNIAKDLLNKIRKEKQKGLIEACFDTEKVLVMIHDSLETSGTSTGKLKKWSENNLENAPNLSDPQVDYLLSQLRLLGNKGSGISITRKEIANAVTDAAMVTLLNKILPNCNCGSVMTSAPTGESGGTASHAETEEPAESEDRGEGGGGGGGGT